VYLGVEDVAVVQPTVFPIEWFAHALFRVNVLVSLAFVVVALLIFWRKSDDWMALLVSAAILSIGTSGLTPATEGIILPGTLLYFFVNVHEYFGYFAIFTMLFFFPDGRFVPRWGRWVCFILVFTLAAVLIAEQLPFAFAGTATETVAVPVLSICALLGVGCMVYRYRKDATLLQRQQLKWVGLGLVVVVASVILYLLVATLLPPEQPSPTRTLFVAFAFPFIVLTNIFLPVSLAIAMLRYRLWDVDIIIRRTLIYTAVTLSLLAVYFLSVVLLQRAFSLLTGQTQNELVTVLSTLAIAALFIPLRNRIQSVIDKRFYRRKYNAQRVLQDFGETVRDETDLEKLTGRLVEVVKDTMQPASVSLWLKQEGGKVRDGE
jgi:hypothetical protein